MRDLILVGAGAYFEGLAGSAIKRMQKDKVVNRFITIDTANITGADLHVERKESQPLSGIVDKLYNLGTNDLGPIVILAHPNHLHTPESKEILENAKSKPLVLIEKPYAVNQDQIRELTHTFSEFKGQVGALEYYLTMKSVPLLLVAGLVKSDSFYFSEPLFKLRSDKNLAELANTLFISIGKPLFVISDILEGEGNYGTISHRNSSLVDKTRGGGMIQDLAHHAFTPLMALESNLGKIQIPTAVRTAFCDSYEQFGVNSFGLSKKNVAESYAEIDITTTTGVPVKIAIGKYVENGTNQRRIKIGGTRGTMIYDMTKNIISLQHGDNVENIVPLLESDKNNVPKYYAVIRAGVETIERNNPFRFNPFEVSMQAQSYIFNVLDMVKEQNMPKNRVYYKCGEMHDQIFQK